MITTSVLRSVSSFVLALLWSASAAFAEPVAEFGVLQPQDVETIQGCLTQAAATSPATAPGGCIGTVATLCLTTSADKPAELVIADCNGREAAAWDRILNETYAKAVIVAKRRDETFAASLIAPAAFQTLRDAQRAWILFRDAECGRIFALFEATEGRLVFSSECSLRLTAERAIVL
ncbi:lysozyme inhibitor LprI family protein [Aureimonas pseudogalii]|uniref:Uncharacterized protein YecT (DUF1311 family) n=1 Tax=Aureimonas pseudogalii TaxID=1744844 RepID=A0A7W6MLF0_9HYPH|nr:lysozyme inhibitor LprI family protein [Aureimonas pseudogalii]MBB3999732.1 uncharacterized protein YecT (DUF1311 family) [Aureimonas pseudogalii]